MELVGEEDFSRHILLRIESSKEVSAFSAVGVASSVPVDVKSGKQSPGKSLGLFTLVGVVEPLRSSGETIRSPADTGRPLPTSPSLEEGEIFLDLERVLHRFGLRKSNRPFFWVSLVRVELDGRGISSPASCV